MSEEKKLDPESVLDAIGAFFSGSDDDSEHKCDNCNDSNGVIKMTCQCGFKLESCAKCLGDRKSEVLSALGEHAGDCEKGRHLLRALTL